MTARQTQAVLTVIGAVIIAAASAVRLLPAPDPSVTFTCPQWDSVRTRGITRTACGDTSAVTAGYLR